MSRTYPIGDLIGTGGMGAVHATRHDSVSVPIVIKVLRPELRGDRSVVARFAAETRAVRRLDHPNLVRYVDAGEDFLVMERAPGTPLGTAIAASGPLSVTRASEITEKILRGLAHAHARSVIHADVKTDNVLIDTAAGDQITVIDFGVARILDDSVRVEDCLVSGTPEYMAPEVIRGEAPTIASDLYGVGVILYELLTGTTPHGGGTIEAILLRHLEDDLVPPSLRFPDRPLAPALERVIMRALAKDPARRFTSAGAFAGALRDAVRGMDDLEDAAEAATSAAFSTEAPTRSWAIVPPSPAPRRQRVARGTRPANDRLDRARASIGDALVRGDLCDIADGYLELARMLVDSGRLKAAISELEEALDMLTAPSPEGTSALPLWPILLSLAALHDGIGDRQRACWFGRRALADAASSGSSTGVSRATRLLSRLAPRCEGPAKVAGSRSISA